jgi:hypothetical protein
MAERRHRVAIVGAGFGGLFAAKALRRAEVDVTVVARAGPGGDSVRTPCRRDDRPPPARRHDGAAVSLSREGNNGDGLGISGHRERRARPHLGLRGLGAVARGASGRPDRLQEPRRCAVRLDDRVLRSRALSARSPLSRCSLAKSPRPRRTPSLVLQPPSPIVRPRQPFVGRSTRNSCRRISCGDRRPSSASCSHGDAPAAGGFDGCPSRCWSWCARPRSRAAISLASCSLVFPSSRLSIRRNVLIVFLAS